MIKKILAFLLAFYFAAPVYAARNFVGSSSNHISSTGTSVTGAPLTMACWMNPALDTGDQSFFWIGDTGGNSNYFRIDLLGNTGGDPISIQANAGAAFQATNSTAGITTGTWFHAMAVITSATDRVIYLNNANNAQGTTSVIPSSVDTITMGRHTGNTPARYYTGNLAECGIWNRAISAGERAALANGFAPNCFPSGLVYYAPSIRETIEIARGLILTASGTTVSTHPRIIYCH